MKCASASASLPLPSHLTTQFHGSVPPPASPSPANDVVLSMADFSLELLDDMPDPEWSGYGEEPDLSFRGEKREKMWAVVDRADRRTSVLDRWRAVGDTLEWAQGRVEALVDEGDFEGMVELTVAMVAMEAMEKLRERELE